MMQYFHLNDFVNLFSQVLVWKNRAHRQGAGTTQYFNFQGWLDLALWNAVSAYSCSEEDQVCMELNAVQAIEEEERAGKG